MSSKVDILEVFPIPIGCAELGRPLTNEEMNFIDELKDHTRVIDQGNLMTLNKYVLDLEPLKQLKDEIESHIRDYFHQVWAPKADSDIDIYITTSWFTYTSKNEGHHGHSHPNSFISGTFYPRVGNDDAIEFPNDRPHYSNINIDYDDEKVNMYNCINYREPVYDGKILMFPSTVRHHVEPKIDEHSRICLAFNTWLKGTIGSYERSTEVKFTDEAYRGN